MNRRFGSATLRTLRALKTPRTLRSPLSSVALAGFCVFGLDLSAPARAETQPPSAEPPEVLSRNLFDEAVDLIRRNYWQEMTREEIELRALRALMADLDPYGRYLGAEEWRELEVEHSSQLAGVGVVIEMDDEAKLPRIDHLLLDSAAGAAGVKPGDWVVSIDGRALADLALDAVFPLLRGAPGTKVALGLRRTSEELPTLVVERKVHRLPSVHGVGRDAAGRALYLLDPNLGLGYVRVEHLAQDSLGEVVAALDDLESLGARGLILDLRDSYGGLMSAGVKIADLFLESGLLAGHASRSGSESFDADPAVAWRHPMVVLINEGTASSSEFLAAALHDHHRARFVGQHTYGKGRVQVKFALTEGQGGLILTSGRHVRPSGIAADRNDPPPANEQAGVAPDPGLELVVVGEEYDLWSKAMSRRASSRILTAAEQAEAPPDRALALASELLAKELASASPAP